VLYDTDIVEVQMKKLLFLGSAITSLLAPVRVLANDASKIEIAYPGFGFKDLSDAVKNFLIVAFAVGLVIVVIMLIWGAFEWIASGGDKESVGKARNRIINALIGFAVLAVAFGLLELAAQFTGLELSKLVIPSPTK